MSRAPEISSELRALLEEVVADPRSAIRLAPRVALREWFERGEAARASDVSRTEAERHLVTAQREALAETLFEAARIAYWKKPVLTLRPRGPDGRPYDEKAAESAWHPLAERRVASHAARGGDVELLRQCLAGIQPESAHALAQASLNLVPSDRARLLFAHSLPADRPRTAMSLFERLCSHACSSRDRAHSFSLWAVRLCGLGQYQEARTLYHEASLHSPDSPQYRLCAFNLSCFLGEEEQAIVEASFLASPVDASDSRISGVAELLRGWYANKSPAEVAVSRGLMARLRGRIPDAAAVLHEVV